MAGSIAGVGHTMPRRNRLRTTAKAELGFREPKVELHAKGLDNPSHMEFTDDGRLLVTERSAGHIVDVTDGGEVGTAESFAWNLERPASMTMLSDGRILVSESSTGKVKDITGGGDGNDADVYAEGLDSPYTLISVEDGDDTRIIVRENNGDHQVGMLEITGGGHADDMDYVVSKIPSKPKSPGITELSDDWWGHWHQAPDYDCGTWDIVADGEVIYSVGALGQFVHASLDDDDVTTHAEHLDDDRILAWGFETLGGSKYNADDGLAYVTEPEEGAVAAFDPDAPMDQRFSPRVVQGLKGPTCVRFGPDNEEMYVCGRYEGVIWKVTDFRA